MVNAQHPAVTHDAVRVLIWLDHMGLRVATLVNLSFLGMDRLEYRTEIPQIAADAFRRETAVAAQQFIQRHAVDIVHDHARSLRIVHGGFVEIDGAAMAEAGHEIDFAAEGFPVMGVRGQVFVHHLDDHLPVRIRLARQVSLAHAPLAEEADGMVSAEENALCHGQDPAARDVPVSVGSMVSISGVVNQPGRATR